MFDIDATILQFSQISALLEAERYRSKSIEHVRRTLGLGYMRYGAYNDVHFMRNKTAYDWTGSDVPMVGDELSDIPQLFADIISLDAINGSITSARLKRWLLSCLSSRVVHKIGTDGSRRDQNGVFKQYPLAGLQSILVRMGGLGHKGLLPLLGANFIQLINASDTVVDTIVPITLSSTSPEGWPFPLAAFGIVAAIRGTVWYMAIPSTGAKELLLFDGVGMGLTGLLHLMVINDKPRTPVVYWTAAIMSTMFLTTFTYKDFLARGEERRENRERNISGRGKHGNQERPGDRERESKWHSSTACPLVVAGTALLVDIFFTAVHQLNTTTATMDQYIFLNIMIPCLVASSGFWSFMFRLMPLH